MPPPSNMRKSSAAMSMTGDPFTSNPHSIAHQNNAPQRRTTGRAIRVSANRPANYYARPFAADHHNAMADASNAQNQQPLGFFPALQFFSDAVTALPKEVMKQFTLMKEVEAKIHGPNEKLGELIDSVMDLPVPPRKQITNGGASANGPQGLLSFTANNSMSGSANPSVVNGAVGRHSTQPSINGSINGEEVQETDEDKARRRQYSDLRMVVHGMLGNLDEKNVVLSEANRVLALQQSRLDSVAPFIEEEISEEARLGSMTHWAYSDNRQKKPVTGATKQRDVAATNNLADAANMIHEREIAQARVAAGREANRDKGKGKRTEHAVDSDFDEKPRKVAKVAKGKAAAAAAASAGLGISNAEAPAKRKKAEKALGAPAMERTASAGGRGAKATRDTPRSTPAAAEPVGKKATKAKPAPTQMKKKVGNSAQNSPMLASSPLASTFNPLNMEPPPGARPSSARVRQGSAATNLRHERLVGDDSGTSRPPSAAGKTNGNTEKVNGRKKIHETTEEHDEPTGQEQAEKQIKEVSERLDREDIEMHDAIEESRPPVSRSNSDKGRHSGRGSKTGTPRLENGMPLGDGLLRSRSVRRKPGPRGEGRDSSSSEPQMQGIGKHRRNASNSHLVKQLAPYNKSPNLDRHRDTDDSSDDEDEEDHAVDAVKPEAGDEQSAAAAAVERESRRSVPRKPVSRGNTLRTSPPPESRESSPPASPPPTITTRTNRSAATSGSSSNAGREIERERERERMKDAFFRERHDRNERERALEVERAAAVATAAAAQPEPMDTYDDAEDSAAVGDPGAIDDDEDSEHDPDDPDEPKYCYCNRGSYGEMVACDNDVCPREWFHLACTELREAPSEEEKWYCRDCRPQHVRPSSGVAGRGGRGKGSRRGGRVM